MRTPFRLRGPAIAVVLGLALSACASETTDTVEADAEEPVTEDAEATDTDSDTDDTDDAEIDDADDADAEGDGAVATDEVVARNINFEPADIEVEAGTTVTWVNEDIVNHTVTSGPAGDPDGMFDEPLQSDGDDVTVTFDEAGTFAYYCDLHRTMIGTVTVTD
jgi:plastocyanin